MHLLASPAREAYSCAMPFLDTKRYRAASLILLLGIGLVYTLWPFITGLVGAPVLFVIFRPVHRWLSRWLSPGKAAAIVLVLAIVLVVGPGISFVGLIANQAQDMATRVIQSPVLARLRELRVGPYDIGAQIEALGAQVVSWI